MKFRRNSPYDQRVVLRASLYPELPTRVVMLIARYGDPIGQDGECRRYLMPLAIVEEIQEIMQDHVGAISV